MFVLNWHQIPFTHINMASINQAARAAAVARQVKPFMSKNPEEARGRVIQLYKAWWREVPHASKDSHMM